MAAISTVSSSSSRVSTVAVDPVLTQQAGQECSTHLTLLFERHSLGHGNCLLRFSGALCVRSSPIPTLRREGEPEAPFWRALDGPPAPAWLRLRRRRADRLVPEPCPSSGRCSVSRGVSRLASVPCRHEVPVPLAPWPPLRTPVPIRDRSRFGRAPTGRTLARTRASTLMRPNSPVFGSVTTMTSASPTATPSWSSASSVASAMVFPATSTHSTLYRAFLVLLDRERGCSFGTATRLDLRVHLSSCCSRCRRSPQRNSFRSWVCPFRWTAGLPVAAACRSPSACVSPHWHSR